MVHYFYLWQLFLSNHHCPETEIQCCRTNTLTTWVNWGIAHLWIQIGGKSHGCYPKLTQKAEVDKDIYKAQAHVMKTHRSQSFFLKGMNRLYQQMTSQKIMTPKLTTNLLQTSLSFPDCHKIQTWSEGGQETKVEFSCWTLITLLYCPWLNSDCIPLYYAIFTCASPQTEEKKNYGKIVFAR